MPRKQPAVKAAAKKADDRCPSCGYCPHCGQTPPRPVVVKPFPLEPPYVTWKLPNQTPAYENETTWSFSTGSGPKGV